MHTPVLVYVFILQLTRRTRRGVWARLGKKKRIRDFALLLTRVPAASQPEDKRCRYVHLRRRCVLPTPRIHSPVPPSFLCLVTPSRVKKVPFCTSFSCVQSPLIVPSRYVLGPSQIFFVSSQPYYTFSPSLENPTSLCPAIDTLLCLAIPSCA